MLNEISTTITLTGEVGTAWESEQLEINGYTFKSVDGATSGLFTVEDIIRNYVYSKNEIPIDPLLRTREQFAIITNHFSNYKPTQSNVDLFIDTQRLDCKVFIVCNITRHKLRGATDYAVLATYGTYIEVEETTKTLVSDGEMYICYSDANNENVGNSYKPSFGYDFEILEKYKRE